jgi:hypothetical protein
MHSEVLEARKLNEELSHNEWNAGIFDDDLTNIIVAESIEVAAADDEVQVLIVWDRDSIYVTAVVQVGTLEMTVQVEVLCVDGTESHKNHNNC